MMIPGWLLLILFWTVVGIILHYDARVQRLETQLGYLRGKENPK